MDSSCGIATVVATVSCAPATQEAAPPSVDVGALQMSLESLVEDQMVDHALSARRETGRCRRVGRLLRERVLDRHGERDRRRLYVAGLRSSAPQRDRPPLRKRSVPRSRNADFVGLAGLRNHNGHVIVLRNSARVLRHGVQAGRAAPTRSSRTRESLPSETTLASHHV